MSNGFCIGLRALDRKVHPFPENNQQAINLQRIFFQQFDLCKSRNKTRKKNFSPLFRRISNKIFKTERWCFLIPVHSENSD